MTNRYRRLLIPILLLIAAAIWVDLPTNPGIHIGSVNRDLDVVRGLDLQGGLRVLMEADLPAESEVTSEQMQAARNIVENRVNALGVTEALVQVAGNRRILVELPGIEDPDKAVSIIRETGLLEFVDFSGLSGSQVITMEGRSIETDFGRPGGLTPPAATPVVEPSAAATTGASAVTPTPGPTPTSWAPGFHSAMTGDRKSTRLHSTH